jgi:acetyl-CoA carboxylase carboxyltransferase component
MEPTAWIEALVDPGSYLPLQPGGPDDACRYGPEVHTGLAEVSGRGVAVYAIDPRVDRGFVSSKGALKVVRLMERAEELGVPVVAFLASPGVSVSEGLASGEAYTQVITRNIRLSGVVPQLAAVMSVTMGAPAYSATLQDLVLFNQGRSHMMVTGPAVVGRMRGEAPTLAALGGAELHSAQTGICDFVDKRPIDQVARLKALLAFLPSHRLEDPPRARDRPPTAELPALPERPEVAFDMTTLLRGLLDGSAWLEVGEARGGSLITAFAHLGGHAVGVVANQSLVDGGALTAVAAQKGARFIRLCDAYNIPVLNLIDVPGFMPGEEEEAAGLLRHGAALCQAMSTGVPRLSVVVRKCYGAAAFVMLQTRSQDGDVVLALPGSRVAVMGFDAARDMVFADESGHSEATLRARYFDEYESPAVAYRAGLIDEVVAASQLRDRLVRHLGWLARKRERPPVTRKHVIHP